MMNTDLNCYKVVFIDFDFDKDTDQATRDKCEWLADNTVWLATDSDDVMEQITDATGFCIRDIQVELLLA